MVQPSRLVMNINPRRNPHFHHWYVMEEIQSNHCTDEKPQLLWPFSTLMTTQAQQNSSLQTSNRKYLAILNKTEFGMNYFFHAFQDWKIWAHMFITFGIFTPLYSFSLFLPTIVKTRAIPMRKRKSCQSHLILLLASIVSLMDISQTGSRLVRSS